MKIQPANPCLLLDRYGTPAADSFMMGIVDDEFDIDMAKEPEEKEAAERSKASKVWRTLRLTARSKLLEFEKIEDGKKINLLFASPEEEGKDGSTAAEDTSKQATDQQDDDAKEEEEEPKDEEPSQEPSQEDPSSSTIPDTKTEQPTVAAATS